MLHTEVIQHIFV